MSERAKFWLLDINEKYKMKVWHRNNKPYVTIYKNATTKSMTFSLEDVKCILAMSDTLDLAVDMLLDRNSERDVTRVSDLQGPSELLE